MSIPSLHHSSASLNFIHTLMAPHFVVVCFILFPTRHLDIFDNSIVDYSFCLFTFTVYLVMSYFERHGAVHGYIQHDATLLTKACEIVCWGNKHSAVLHWTNLCQILSANGLYFPNRVCMFQSQAVVHYLTSFADGNAAAQTSVLNQNTLFYVGSVLKELLRPACPLGTQHPQRRTVLHQSAQTCILIGDASSPFLP
jgi:hypothetical protein